MSTTLRLTLGPQAAQLHDVQTGALVARIEAGYEAMRSRHFGRARLDAGALERAIEWTEDQIQAAHAAVPAGARLCTSESDVRLIARAAGLSADAPLLHVDAVEQTFSRLVLQAFGQSPHQEDLPDEPRVFATVVLLREMLHHLRFGQIQIEADPAQA
jgi:hypothetical protein